MAKCNKNENCWFSHDVTKIQTIASYKTIDPPDILLS